MRVLHKTETTTTDSWGSGYYSDDYSGKIDERRQTQDVYVAGSPDDRYEIRNYYETYDKSNFTSHTDSVDSETFTVTMNVEQGQWLESRDGKRNVNSNATWNLDFEDTYIYEQYYDSVLHGCNYKTQKENTNGTVNSSTTIDYSVTERFHPIYGYKESVATYKTIGKSVTVKNGTASNKHYNNGLNTNITESHGSATYDNVTTTQVFEEGTGIKGSTTTTYSGTKTSSGLRSGCCVYENEYYYYGTFDCTITYGAGKEAGKPHAIVNDAFQRTDWSYVRAPETGLYHWQLKNSESRTLDYEGFLSGGIEKLPDQNLYKIVAAKNPVLLGEGQPISHDNGAWDVSAPKNEYKELATKDGANWSVPDEVRRPADEGEPVPACEICGMEHVVAPYHPSETWTGRLAEWWYADEYWKNVQDCEFYLKKLAAEKGMPVDSEGMPSAMLQVIANERELVLNISEGSLQVARAANTAAGAIAVAQVANNYFNNSVQTNTPTETIESLVTNNGSTINDDNFVHFGHDAYDEIKLNDGKSFWFQYGDVKFLTPEGIVDAIGPLAKSGEPGGASVIHVPKSMEGFEEFGRTPFYNYQEYIHRAPVKVTPIPLK